MPSDHAPRRRFPAPASRSAAPFVLAALLLGPTILTAQTLTFAEGGRMRDFVVVRDEVAIRDADGRIRHQGIGPVSETAEVLRQSRRLRPAAGEQVEIMLREERAGVGAPRIRYVKPEVVVEADSAADAMAAAQAQGLTYVGPTAARGFYVLHAADSAAALEAAPTLAARSGVRSATPSLAGWQGKRLIPNDTYFSSQWHLRNTGQSGGVSGVDANIVSVWDSYRGSGVRIGIVDDGLQTTHPDLAANVDTTNDQDWNDSTPNDPSPAVAYDYHGTACAGVAAAVGGNSLGVSGAAPAATLVGLRLIAAPISDSDIAEAFAWKNDLIQIKSNSWGPVDMLDGPGPLATAALATAAQSGRGGLGTIILFAAGNDGHLGDNANYDGYTASIHTIAVGAVTNTGLQSYYSEPGANLAVSAPSNGGSDPGITTTDLVGSNGYNYLGAAGNLSSLDYTNDFGGTSSATPLVSGVVALILEAKPSLGWRDVQEILMKSATQNAPTDSDWTTNAGGFRFNHKFGAGMVNAAAAVALAKTWTNLPAATSQTLARTSLGQSIPDNNASGTSVTFNLSGNANLRVEHVTVAVKITHANRGQLAIQLVSPQGTVSRLAEKHTDSGDDYDWTFMTVRNWGESSQGVWTLRVIDQTSGTTGSITAATLTVHGVPAAEINRRPGVQSAEIGGSELFAENPTALVNVAASDPESDPFTLAYQWQLSTDGGNFADIAGAVSPTLSADASRAGKLVRCRLVASDSTGPGASFTTEPRALNRRPAVVAAAGSAYSYDSELFLLDRSGNFNRSAIINEFSQGNTPSGDWIEILFLRETDTRGWTLADRNNTILTFSQATLWSSVPAGTLLVIYYNTFDKDTILPANKTTPGSSRTLVIAHNNGTYFAGSWPAFSNSLTELLALRTSTGALVDSLSYNGDISQNPALGTVGANKSAAYQSDTDAGADIAANWTIQSAAAGVATPASGNGGVNTTFVAALVSGIYDQPAVFTFGAASQTPAGLMIDPETGVLSGVVTAEPGVYSIVIERANGVESTSQTVRLLVTAADGSATIQSGASWSPLIPTTLSSLTVAGTLDTNGQALTVTGAITISGGAVLNASPGSITYGSLSGGTLPGSTTAVSAYANWIASYPTLTGDAALRTADPDGDGQPNLLEQALGTNPTDAGSRTLLAPTVVANRLHLAVPRGAWPQLTYRVEASADLAAWAEAWKSTGAQNTATTVEVSDIADIPTGGRRFLRLVVSEP